MIRRCARCSKCGRKGASLTAPSWESLDIGFALFPVERIVHATDALAQDLMTNAPPSAAAHYRALAQDAYAAAKLMEDSVQ